MQSKKAMNLFLLELLKEKWVTAREGEISGRNTSYNFAEKVKWMWFLNFLKSCLNILVLCLFVWILKPMSVLPWKIVNIRYLVTDKQFPSMLFISNKSFSVWFQRILKWLILFGTQSYRVKKLRRKTVSQVLLCYN